MAWYHSPFFPPSQFAEPIALKPDHPVMGIICRLGKMIVWRWMEVIFGYELWMRMGSSKCVKCIQLWLVHKKSGVHVPLSEIWLVSLKRWRLILFDFDVCESKSKRMKYQSISDQWESKNESKSKKEKHVIKVAAKIEVWDRQVQDTVRLMSLLNVTN